MVILNVRFKIIFPKNGCCYETNPSNDLYDSQQEETKSAINLLFSNSSKLVSSITTIVPTTEIGDAYNVFANKKRNKQHAETILNSDLVKIDKNNKPDDHILKLTIV